MKKYILLLSLLATTRNAHPSSLNKDSLPARFLGALGTSRVNEWHRNTISSPLEKIIYNTMQCGNEPASPFYIDTLNEIYDELNTPLAKRVPAYKLPQLPQFEFFGALATSNGIFINETGLDKTPLGHRRFALFHEAIHNHFSDVSCDGLLEMTILPTIIYSTYKTLPHISFFPTSTFAKASLAAAAGFTIDILTTILFHKFIERRADIKAGYATKCHICVSETANCRRKRFEEDEVKSPLRFNGYLWANDLEKIAADLKKDDLVCKYHNQPSIQ